ncbi:type I secretion system permease/ATPase [Desulforhopalus singaporensis]|uniref:ATP-binding cassette, subfamily C, LapB n=1 Tax=Desulforhopalus singaporensis TaxID=91360 RepID=A0A1H0R793_9BACT|nr:type I secretion system permease/ATPase [Desulforhopalus singaporensis]SDP25019.1 ATP-binding cassette, subfamily C, LapB [Desulforhopalus singaporensis]
MNRYHLWIEAFTYVARFYGVGFSPENLKVMADWDKDSPVEEAVLQKLADQIGLSLTVDKFRVGKLSPWRVPFVLELEDGTIGTVDKIDRKKNISFIVAGEKNKIEKISVDQLKNEKGRIFYLRPPSSVADARVDEYLKPFRKNWLWTRILRDWRRYIDIVLASLVANLLALGGIMFSMQVYDRVVPSQSTSTLWVLFAGVCIAFGFEFILKICRTRISDLIGKKVDLGVSDLVFGRALRIKNQARSKSTGTFIAQIREVESVRELITSTTINALIDLPFLFMFLAILFLIGGPLVLVVVLLLPVLILPGLIAQKPLARLSNEGMREAALRNAMLIEAVEGIEDIKLLRAEPRFQNLWNQMQSVTAKISMEQRFIVNGLQTWTHQVQSFVFVAVVLTGSFLVMNGDMTTGALVGTSILSSRMMAPITQLAGVMTRWQNAKVAKHALDELLSRPLDNPEKLSLVHRTKIDGNFNLQRVSFAYNKDSKKIDLAIGGMKIKAGEKISLVGRIGAGKTTLLHLLAGLLTPEQGNVQLDGMEMALLDPGDVRRDVGMLSQNARLFFGTVRENLLLGRPLASDEEILSALTISGAIDFIQSLPGGLDYQIWEGGIGLSGGQKQSLLLARTILCDPKVVLLDEPTSSFDEVTEKNVLKNLSVWAKDRTVIVATHRMALVEWSDRLIVLEQGRIIKDAPVNALHRKTQKRSDINVAKMEKTGS